MSSLKTFKGREGHTIQQSWLFQGSWGIHNVLKCRPYNLHTLSDFCKIWHPNFEWFVWILGHWTILVTWRGAGREKDAKGPLPKRLRGLPRRPGPSIHSAGTVNSWGSHFMKNFEQKTYQRRCPLFCIIFWSFWVAKGTHFQLFLEDSSSLSAEFLENAGPSNSQPLPT